NREDGGVICRAREAALWGMGPAVGGTPGDKPPKRAPGRRSPEPFGGGAGPPRRGVYGDRDGRRRGVSAGGRPAAATRPGRGGPVVAGLGGRQRRAHLAEPASGLEGDCAERP